MITRQFAFLAATLLTINGGMAFAKTQNVDQQQQKPVIEVSQLTPDTAAQRQNVAKEEARRDAIKYEEPVHNIKL